MQAVNYYALHLIGNSPGVARASFFKGTGWILADSTQSKRWRIQLLYRYKRARTRRNSMFTLFTLNNMFTLSGVRQSL